MPASRTLPGLAVSHNSQLQPQVVNLPIVGQHPTTYAQCAPLTATSQLLNQPLAVQQAAAPAQGQQAALEREPQAALERDQAAASEQEQAALEFEQPPPEYEQPPPEYEQPPPEYEQPSPEHAWEPAVEQEAPAPPAMIPQSLPSVISSYTPSNGVPSVSSAKRPAEASQAAPEPKRSVEPDDDSDDNDVSDDDIQW